MGLLHYLFGDKRKYAVQIQVAAERRLMLWQEHLARFARKSELVKNFNYANVKDHNNYPAIIKHVLPELKSLISQELLEHPQEEKEEHVLIAQLEELIHRDKLLVLVRDLAEEKQKQKIVLSLLQQLYCVLIAELHLIDRIIKNYKDDHSVEKLLIHLFEIIFYNEQRLTKALSGQSFFQESVQTHVRGLVKAILLEEQFHEAVETAEETFAQKVVALLHEGSKSDYRKLAELIYEDLADQTGAPFSKFEEVDLALTKIDQMASNESILTTIIKRLRPRYNPSKIKSIVIAFQKAHRDGHFEGLVAGLYT